MTADKESAITSSPALSTNHDKGRASTTAKKRHGRLIPSPFLASMLGHQGRRHSAMSGDDMGWLSGVKYISWTESQEQLTFCCHISNKTITSRAFAFSIRTWYLIAFILQSERY